VKILYNKISRKVRKFAYKRRGIPLNYTEQAIELPALKKGIPEFGEKQLKCWHNAMNA
jgi:hypothetical protein